MMCARVRVRRRKLHLGLGAELLNLNRRIHDGVGLLSPLTFRRAIVEEIVMIVHLLCRIGDTIHFIASLCGCLRNARLRCVK